MPRYKLTIAYDGTDFCGWQKQEPPASEHPDLPVLERGASSPKGDDRDRVALRTVQHVVEQSLRDLLREPITLVGASRTDSGVHASGQVAAFTSAPLEDRGVGWPESRGTDALVRALNGRLPRDVLVRSAEVVDESFSPISDAIEKEYTYCIASGPERPLWDRRYVFHTWHELDTALMDAAAQHLVGEHDFASFAQINHGRKTTVRRIFACGVSTLSPWGRGQGEGSSDSPLPRPDGGGAERSEAEGVFDPATPHDPQDPSPRPSPPRGEGGMRYHVIRVRGNGFLYNMVRILAGTLMEAGRGTLDPNRIPEILESKDRTANPGPTLPPQGLRLEWIRYGDEDR
ncbi:MAG: tRNA pseudouridine synthase A [Phycisphaerales bacterium]